MTLMIVPRLTFLVTVSVLDCELQPSSPLHSQLYSQGAPQMYTQSSLQILSLKSAEESSKTSRASGDADVVDDGVDDVVDDLMMHSQGAPQMYNQSCLQILSLQKYAKESSKTSRASGDADVVDDVVDDVVGDLINLHVAPQPLT